jgi:hypothetical protein
MPLQVITTEGVLDDAQQQAVFAQLTDLLLELNDLTGHPVMTPNVIGEVTVLPKGRTYAGGQLSEIVIFELKVPAIVLPTRDSQLAWVKRGTEIIVKAAAGKITSDKVWGNVSHAVDGTWAINGHAYTNDELVSVLAA